MNKLELVQSLIGDKPPKIELATAFAPSNIALCKYWGKREQELNLPVTSSLSISLGDKGTFTKLKVSNNKYDSIKLNELVLSEDTVFYKRLVQFLDLFRSPNLYFDVETTSNIPVSAGLASSASGFAATVKALDQLFDWQLSKEKLSILARLGSGSACRSLWHGFVLWEKGQKEDGMDCFGKLLPTKWPDLRLGLLIFAAEEKKISSRKAMQITVDNCSYYSLWPSQVGMTLNKIMNALEDKNFSALGQAAETNCLEMHALMLASKPPILYSNAGTLNAMNKVWQLRKEGVEVYFTQDAGPNIKLLFLEGDQTKVMSQFPDMEVVLPWNGGNKN